MSKKSSNSIQYIIYKSKEVFVRKGFGNVTMIDIVERCDIRHGGLYHHFSSVKEIFESIVIQEKDTVDLKSDIDYINVFFENMSSKLIKKNIYMFRALIEYEVSKEKVLKLNESE